MKKIILMLFASIIVTSCLCSCGKPMDETNKNITAAEEMHEIKGVNIYYDNNSNMRKYAGKGDFNEIVYAIGATAQNVFSSSDCPCTVNEVTNEIKESSFEELRRLGTNVNQKTMSDFVLKQVLPRIEKEQINVIITDMSYQLKDYSTIANELSHCISENGLAVAFIGVQVESAPLFAIVTAPTEDLSKYINNLKKNTTISKYDISSGSDYQEDKAGIVNYQIVANKSGVIGIDYQNVRILENSTYPDYNGKSTLETRGSFTDKNEEYTTKLLEGISSDDEIAAVDTIEGTVNFSAEKPRFVNIKRNKESGGTGEYIGAQSLVSKDSEGLAGKIKIEIPFKVIDGVKLSKLHCEWNPIMKYSSDGGAFKPCSYDNMLTFISKWQPDKSEPPVYRIDDKKNSMIFNIVLRNAADFPENSKAIKLDINFRHNDDLDSVSYWVKNWDEKGVDNLLNFFNALYTNINNNSTASNDLTIYIGKAR